MRQRNRYGIKNGWFIVSKSEIALSPKADTRDNRR